MLDLAAGTGKLTRLLAEGGADVVAVEPVAAMRAVLAEAMPEITVLDGTAETIPLGPASVDAVTVAQAFHWFDAEAALAEIHRVLRRGGGLGLIWNAMDSSPEWVAVLKELVQGSARPGAAVQRVAVARRLPVERPLHAAQRSARSPLRTS